MTKKFMELGFRSIVWLLCFLLLCPPQMVLAGDPVPSGATNTTINNAANGVPVVNIAAPNGSGMSHNAFTQYNVDTHGVVLNNGDMSEAFRQSQLAGQLAANPNLAAGNQASIILNEVTGGSRSTLAGFTEVLGGKADVIIANPFGITSSGGGFINTDRVSLVTGAPDMTGGTLNGFNVRGGDILITGTGLNANSQQILDLVSRKIVVGGQVNAPTLNMVAGTNHWNSATGATSPIASDGSAVPAYAIDSSALGGMYAGRINLKATEAGVGVRIKGDAAATADDFIITASGKIEVGSKISAARDLSITSTNTASDAIKATDANLTAGRNLGLTAIHGGATLDGGGIKADKELAYNLGSLTDRRSDAPGITDANKRYGNTVILTNSGRAVIDGVSYGAGSHLQIDAASHVIGAFDLTSLYSDGSMGMTATGSDMSFSKAALKSFGDMDLTSTAGGMHFDAGAGQGVQSTAGNINFFAETDLTNYGIITADKGNIIARVNASLQNNGSIHAYDLLDFRGKTTAKSHSVWNTGSLLGGSVNIQTGMLLVRGVDSTLESSGDMNVTADYLTVGSNTDATARILAATSGAGVGNIAGIQQFINYGSLHSGYDLNVMGQESFSNESTGGISAFHDLTARATHANLVNAGALYAGNDLAISSSSTLINDATFTDPLGTIGSGHDMTIQADEFINYSSIDAVNNLTISARSFKNMVKDGGGPRSWGSMEYEHKTELGRSSPSNKYTMYYEMTSEYPEVFDNIFNRTATIYGNIITIKDFDSAINLGATISGDTVNIIGKNSSSTFDNSDILTRKMHCSYLRDEEWEGDTFKSATSGPVTTTYTSSPRVRSSIRAYTLNMGSLGLTTRGTPLTSPSPYVRTATGKTFTSPTLNLPTNPNGMFVTKKDPNANYLVETNPLFTNLDNYLGSDYLIKKYNFSSDEVIKRLGDAGYETYLVGQQLATKGGRKLLPQYANAKEQMKGLMDSAVNQTEKLGLKMGAKLSKYQQSLLKEDMVWMVKTVVKGQTVLAPVVYLAASTKKMFALDNRASISGKNVNLNLTSLTNEGSTISGSKTLNITAQGDIKNTSGTISGGDVALTSTGGSIINKTLAETKGGSFNQSTSIGKKAGIVAKGNLNIDAAKDITTLGGKIAAGGDASLTAGNNVVLDTVKNKETSRTYFSGTTTTSTIKQIGSSLSSGGNLSVKAKNDITLGGSTVRAGGNADLNAGKDLNVMSRDDSSHTVNTISKQGFGVGGGLYGKEDKTTDNLKTSAIGSTVKAGGNVNLVAGKTTTLQGAKVNARGDINVAASDVNILEARDVDRTTTKTETISLFSFSKGEGDTSSSSATSSAESSGAKAEAEASATNDAGGLDIMKRSTTNTFDKTTTAKGSQVAAGGNLNITSKKDTLIRGADVKAGGDINLSGKNVDIMATQDTHVSTSKTVTTKIGLYASTSNKADAKAGVDAKADANISSAGASASSTAKAKADSNTNIDVMRTKTTETETTDIINKGTSLASGGNLKINAGNTLTVQGSGVSGEQGVEVNAKDMAFQAAQDTHTSSTTVTKNSFGLYVDGTANANAVAGAEAKASLGANAGASAKADVKATVSVGLQSRNESTKETEGTSTARVSTITSGSGSISRTAENSITDVGTGIEAGGDFNQSAKTFTSKAAENTSFKTSESTSNTAKVGAYAKAEAGANAVAGANIGMGDGTPKAEAGAKVEATGKVAAGIKASYNRDNKKSASTSSDAVVSTIKVGGKIKSSTTGATSFEGTQMSAGKGVELEAGSVDFKAAKNTTSEKSSASNINGAFSAGVTRGSGKGVEGGVSGGTSKTDKKSSTSTAIAGGIESGGNISIKTKGNTRLEGTNLAATGDTNIDAGGKIVIDAARDTKTSSEKSYDASASLSVGKKSGESKFDAKVGGGYSKESSTSSTAKAGSIATGGKLNLTAGKSIDLEGTNMAAGGDATLNGAEGVNFKAAKSTSDSKSFGVRAGLVTGKTQTSNAEAQTSSKTAGVTAAVNHDKSKESIAEAGSLTSGGNLLIKSNKDVSLEGTNLAAKNKASIKAGGAVNFTAAESTSESTAFGASLSGSASTTKKTPKAVAQNPAPAVSEKAKNLGTGGTQGSDGSKSSSEALTTWQKNHGSIMQELKNKQNPTPPATPPSSVPVMPTPPNADTKAAPEKKKSITFGAQFQKKDKTIQKAGSITAGAGGIDISAGGGNVNLVGTNLETTGNANIAATDDVNITTTKNTDSSFGFTVAGSMDKKTAPPTKPSPSATAAKRTPPPVPTAPKPQRPGAVSNKTKTSSTSATKTPPPVPTTPKPQRPGAVSDKTKTSSTSATKTPPPVPTAPKPQRPGAVSDKTKTSSTSATKTPPPVPTAPKPQRPGAVSDKTKTSSTSATKTPPPVPTAPKPQRPGAVSDKTKTSSTSATKTPPPVPTAPKPQRPGAVSDKTKTSSTSATKTPPPVPTTPKPARSSVSIGTMDAKPLVSTKPGVSTNWGGEVENSATTAKDPDNTTSVFVGVGGGGSVQNQGAMIKTGGVLNISSDGKTTLVNTDIKTDSGTNINAAGGVKRKTEKDVNIFNANTDSGPASVNQVISKVPMSSAASGGTPTQGVPGGTPVTSTSPQSSMKAAQGGISTIK
ncbi:MAG: hemagglutinin repeat-containing protein [Pseudodesulfovibrio sp.]|nr:hemagglutinin repeat-containing protein [Pseudodesulfovibrio sp.]